MAAEARYRTCEQRLDALALAILTPDLLRHALVRRALHITERLTHSVFGKKIEKWRLSQLHCQGLLERPVEDGVTGRVNYIGKQDGVFFSEHYCSRSMEVKKEDYR